MHDQLQAEIDWRLANGCKMVSVRELGEAFKALGYRLNRSMDCQSMARYVSGPRAGATHPVITTDATEIATGKSYAHYQGARDANFRKMMELRQTLFAVTRGCILEV